VSSLGLPRERPVQRDPHIWIVQRVACNGIRQRFLRASEEHGTIRSVASRIPPPSLSAPAIKLICRALGGDARGHQLSNATVAAQHRRSDEWPLLWLAVGVMRRVRLSSPEELEALGLQLLKAAVAWIPRGQWRHLGGVQMAAIAVRCAQVGC
jgi:hypothetical protein